MGETRNTFTFIKFILISVTTDSLSLLYHVMTFLWKHKEQLRDAVMRYVAQVGNLPI